jgi:hypothetical protein
VYQTPIERLGLQMDDDAQLEVVRGLPSRGWMSLLFRDMQPILAAHCETVRDLCISFVEVVAALSCGW